MPWAAVAAAGAVISAGASIAGGIAQGNAASYQAQVAANNAKIAQQNSVHAAQVAAVQTEQAGLKARADQGRIRAALGASGLDVNSGSSSDVQSGQRQLGYLDTSTVANKGALDVYGYKTQGTNFQAQSELYKSEAGSAPVLGALKGVGGLLSSAENFSKGFGGGGGEQKWASGSYDTTHGEGFSSLLSGTPSASGSWSWMGGNPTNGEL